MDTNRIIALVKSHLSALEKIPVGPSREDRTSFADTEVVFSDASKFAWSVDYEDALLDALCLAESAKEYVEEDVYDSLIAAGVTSLEAHDRAAHAQFAKLGGPLANPWEPLLEIWTMGASPLGIRTDGVFVIVEPS